MFEIDILSEEFLKDTLKTNLAQENSVCINLSEDNVYDAKAMELAQDILDNPNFIYLTDEETSTLMSQCANKIINRKQIPNIDMFGNNNGLIIAPYHPYDKTYFEKFRNNELRYLQKAKAIHLYPINWVLLDESETNFNATVNTYIKDKNTVATILDGFVERKFNIYTGDHRQLDICKGAGDFYFNLCLINKKLENQDVTVVTAYYDVKNKHPDGSYNQWAKNLLSINFKLVVFSDKKNLPWIKELRGDLPAIYVEKNREDFNSYQYKDKYEYFYHKVTTEKYHSPELYMVWAEKVKFVNEAINLNPYGSNFYIWCDFGIIREERYLHHNFPNNQFMQQDKISILLIKDFEQIYYKLGYAPDISVTFGTGIQAGDKRSWKLYDKLCDTIRKTLFEKNIILGNDQAIAATTYMWFPELFNVIYQDLNYKDNRWFYTLDYFATEDNS